MYTLELTADELRIVRGALRSYLSDFGHDEGDVLRTIRALVSKINQVELAGETDAGSRTESA